jgi:hypothetical protein
MESSNLGNMSSDYIDVNDINNVFIRQDGGGRMGKLIPGKKCHPIYIGMNNNKNVLIKQDEGGWMESSYLGKMSSNYIDMNHSKNPLIRQD